MSHLLPKQLQLSERITKTNLFFLSECNSILESRASLDTHIGHDSSGPSSAICTITSWASHRFMCLCTGWKSSCAELRSQRPPFWGSLTSWGFASLARLCFPSIWRYRKMWSGPVGIREVWVLLCCTLLTFDCWRHCSVENQGTVVLLK